MFIQEIILPNEFVGLSFKSDSSRNIKLTSCERFSSQISAEIWTGLICATV